MQDQNRFDGHIQRIDPLQPVATDSPRLAADTFPNAAPFASKGLFMKRLWLLASLFAAAIVSAGMLHAQVPSQIVVLAEQGFPTVDTGAYPAEVLHRALPTAIFSSVTQLQANLNDSKTTLLVVPYGSAFPEEQWTNIHNFLLRGGNLLTLGGRPFTRPARFISGCWQLLPETYAFSRQLLISDYQKTPGSSDVTPTPNPDEPVAGIESLRWQQAYSMVIRLSQEETSNRIGTSGTLDAELKPLLWGNRDGSHVAAPVVEIDHFRNDYLGGRWIMVNCDMDGAFSESAHVAAIITALTRQASVGAELVHVTPTYPLYLPQEAWQLELQWNRYQQPAAPSKADITIQRDGQQELAQTVNLDFRNFPANQTITLPSNGQPGFHVAEVRLYCGNASCGVYRTAFWVRDKGYLDSGPRVAVSQDYFLMDGQPIEVIGTTYMASDAQRLYFRYPNPYVWDQDMKQISSAGINMLRTGLWTDWDLVAGNTDVATERARRTIEAYLMTARRYNLPVQFTLFSFMPEVFGGKNTYLDPEAVRREQDFVASIVQPFADVPFLVWDLINEPSFDNPKRLFGTHPNGDPIESAAWNKWLMDRYDNRNAIDEAWHTVLPDGPIAPPDDSDMTAQSANDGGHPLAVYDFNLFAQESFATWAQGMRTVIRNTGSRQLVTVGQDEGGALISPSPSFFAPAVDFTTIHSWWFYDDLLWDSLSAKQKGLPMLIQETGVMTETDADGRPRRNPDQDAALLERKIGVAIATGAGAIEWLWNTNAIMRSQQEVTIGAVRPDGTEKQEASVLKAYTAFAKTLRSHLDDPEPEPVTILTSQAEQFSVLGAMATEAQHRSIRAMTYRCRIAARMVSENHIDDIAGSKLTILPSAQMLQDSTWQKLLNYVEEGGNLLITGPLGRDQHWQLRDRLRQIGIQSTTSSLIYRSTSIQVGTDSVEADFPIAVQRNIETLKLTGGQSYLEVKYGKGRVFLVSAPVELAESPDATVMVYRHVLAQLEIKPSFEDNSLPSSVLVRPLVLRDAVLYLLSSESSDDQDIDLHDDLSGGWIKLHLPALRTTLVLLNRKTGQITTAYHGPTWPDELTGNQ
jgi:hypothetical protein